MCQQKLLQAYSMDPPLARTYPPTVMEWKANRKRVNMALEGRFPDGTDLVTPPQIVFSSLMQTVQLNPRFERKLFFRN